MKASDYPLGSARSRAAARMLLEQWQRSQERREVIIAGDKGGLPHAQPWRNSSEGNRMGRVVSVPEGWTLADGLRAIGGYSAAELERVSELHPGKVNCGTMLALRR